MAGEKLYGTLTRIIYYGRWPAAIVGIAALIGLGYWLG